MTHRLVTVTGHGIRQPKNLLVPIGASYGDAFMAAVGVGLFKDLTEITRWVKNKKVVSPNPEVHKQYALNYKIFRDLYNQTKSLMHELSDSQKT